MIHSVCKHTVMAVSLLVATSAFGDITIVYDTFDSDAVGSPPANWTLGPGYLGAANPTVVRYVTNNISNPPSAPNVFMSDAPNGSPGYINTRSFTSTALPTYLPLVISFDFRLDRIDNSFNGFTFNIMTANGSQQPFALPRVSGGPATYTLYSDSSQAHALAPGLATGSWYSLAFSINFTNNNGNGGTGFTTWTLSNLTTSVSTLLTNQAFTLTSSFYTNIASVNFWDYGPGEGGERLYLDNLQVAIIPEPSTLWLAGVGVGLFALRRRR